MQGQRGTIGSLPETLDFDLGTTSNNAAIDQQICWNDVRSAAENRMQDFMLSPSEMNSGFVNPMSHERPNLSRWCLNEPSSSNTQNEVIHDERKAEQGCSSSVSPCAALAAPRFEGWRHEPTNNISLDSNVNPMFTQSSNSDTVPQNLNLNAGFAGQSGSNSQAMEFPNSFKFGASENDQLRPVSGADPFLLPSGSAGFLVGESDGRPNSLEGRRISCKRKAIEGNVGQSSASGSCSYFQHAENSVRPGVTAQYNAGSSLRISSSSEQGNTRLGLGGRDIASSSFPDSNVPESSESTQRNFRLRTNSSNQPNSNSPNIFSTRRAVRHSNVPSPQVSPVLLRMDNSDGRPIPANVSTQNQLSVLDIPPLPQNVPSIRWNEGSRTGSSTSSSVFGDRDAPPREALHSRSLTRTMLDNVARHPASRSSAGASLSIPGNNSSTNRTGSNSSLHPSSAPTWAPPNFAPYPRRISEYIRRSMIAAPAPGTESGGHNSNFPPLRPGQPASSPDLVLPVAGHHPPHPRLASWMERHNDNALGIPYSLRSWGASGDGSNRLASEIQTVLGLMRRNGSGSLRVEDVMFLDPAVFMGMPDIHDRHRDMRLDVDNMSYEELLALEERIGNVNTGLSEETILNRLKKKKYSIAVKSECETEPCCVCQEDYNDGEDIGTLECGHDFHTECIKQWLTRKNLCPICKTTALTS
ncbi:hypothetical protein UlMin_035272 [Ulmus minor]